MIQILIGFLLVVCAAMPAGAEVTWSGEVTWTGDSVRTGAASRLKETEEVVPRKPKERISFKVNAVDWALVIANVGLEYDLSASPYGRYTLGANVRYTGGVSKTFVPRVDVELLDVRCELRRYWRQRMTMRRGQKRTPKLWRAYYWGAYVGYSDYKVFVPNGFMGTAINLGGSFGYEKPLLKFRHGYLDLDLGLSAGFSYQKYDKTKVVDDERQLVKRVDGKLIPYPLISEIRVGLVYRFQSIRDKYTKKRHN